jgi:hypothetical protein
LVPHVENEAAFNIPCGKNLQIHQLRPGTLGVELQPAALPSAAKNAQLRALVPWLYIILVAWAPCCSMACMYRCANFGLGFTTLQRGATQNISNAFWMKIWSAGFLGIACNMSGMRLRFSIFFL